MPPDQSEIPNYRFNDRQVTWALDGKRFHFSHFGRRRTPECPSLQPQWFSFDGRATHNLFYEASVLGKDDTKEVNHATTQSLATKTDSELRMGMTPGLWLGIYFSMSASTQSGVTLRQILAEATTTVAGTDTLNGRDCPRVDLRLRTPTGVNVPFSVWFDPLAGWLPRKISISPTTYVVDSFREVTEKNGNMVWIPSRMFLENSWVREELEVADVKLGDAVDSSLFRPQLPAGKPIFNIDENRDVQAYIAHISKPEVDRIKADLAAAPKPKAMPLPAAVSPATVARAPRSFGSRHILLITALAIALVSSVAVYRR